MHWGSSACLYFSSNNLALIYTLDWNNVNEVLNKIKLICWTLKQRKFIGDMDSESP